MHNLCTPQKRPSWLPQSQLPFLPADRPLPHGPTHKALRNAGSEKQRRLTRGTEHVTSVRHTVPCCEQQPNSHSEEKSGRLVSSWRSRFPCDRSERSVRRLWKARVWTRCVKGSTTPSPSDLLPSLVLPFPSWSKRTIKPEEPEYNLCTDLPPLTFRRAH